MKRKGLKFACIEECRDTRMILDEEVEGEEGEEEVRSGSEFSGWGSKPLVEFLGHIGQDTARPISHLTVASLINKYVTNHNLLHPTKKRSIVCDEWLLPLFGKKIIPRNKIYELLGNHFPEEKVSDFSGKHGRGATYLPLFHNKKTTSNKSNAPLAAANKGCSAAIVPENIKLVYFKKGFVLKLVREQPHSFQRKLIGGFVRIKTDPYDCSQKNSHMLVQVIGINRNAVDGGKDSEVLLWVSNCIKDVSISKLSDDNFSKEECEDLHQRVQNGLVKRPTVVELEEKVQILHEDMMKHWLVGELALLQRQIDQANEKGWRQELSEYIERKQLLQTVEEQSRLLREVPKIIVEEIGVQGEIAGKTDWKSVANGKEVESKRCSISDYDDIESRIQKVVAEGIQVEKVTNQLAEVEATQCGGPDEENDVPLEIAILGALRAPDCDADTNESSSNSFCIARNISDEDLEQWRKKGALVTQAESCGESQPLVLKEEKFPRGMEVKQFVEVTELSDDEGKVEHGSAVYDHESLMWHYIDPQGDVQGPFPLSSLKRWNDNGYFPRGFKVWSTGQRQEEALLLSKVISLAFHS